MKTKKFLGNPWLYACLGLLAGFVIGYLSARWHYKELYKNNASCGSINYYDKTGKVKLYSDNSCPQ